MPRRGLGERRRRGERDRRLGDRDRRRGERERERERCRLGERDRRRRGLGDRERLGERRRRGGERDRERDLERPMAAVDMNKNQHLEHRSGLCVPRFANTTSQLASGM